MARTLSRNDIPLLVLAVLGEGPSHGYAIAREIERRSRALLHLNEGALYPALKILEGEELVESQWETLGGGPARKVYRITKTGRAHLRQKASEWAQYREAIDTFLGGTSHAPAT